MDTSWDTDHLDPDLRDRLDAALGDGPPHRPVDDRLTAGRRALLRRRVGTAIAAAAVVAVAGTSYAVATDGERAADPPGYAASPAAPATGEVPTVPPFGGDSRIEGAVRLEGHALVAREGFRIVEQRTGVDLGASRERTAVALVDGEDGRTWWVAWAADGRLHYTFQQAAPGETMADVIADARAEALR